MPKIFRAHTSSRKFNFEAYATEESVAATVLVEALENHGRQYGLDEKWWEGHCDLEVEAFNLGRGYRDGTPLPDGPTIGVQPIRNAIVRATMYTEHFFFEAYGTRATAKEALIASLKAHSAQCNPPLQGNWWRGHYDLNTYEFLLGVGYRDRSPVPNIQPERRSGPGL
jgi:hypothetical protein